MVCRSAAGDRRAAGDSGDGRSQQEADRGRRQDRRCESGRGRARCRQGRGNAQNSNQRRHMRAGAATARTVATSIRQRCLFSRGGRVLIGGTGGWCMMARGHRCRRVLRGSKPRALGCRKQAHSRPIEDQGQDEQQTQRQGQGFHVVPVYAGNPESGIRVGEARSFPRSRPATGYRSSAHPVATRKTHAPTRARPAGPASASWPCATRAGHGDHWSPI